MIGVMHNTKTDAGHPDSDHDPAAKEQPGLCDNTSHDQKIRREIGQYDDDRFDRHVGVSVNRGAGGLEVFVNPFS